MSPYVRALGVSRNQSAEQLVAACGGIIKGLTDNPAYPNPPVDLKTLQAAVDNLSAALAAQAHGGPAATAEKNNKQADLISIMRKLKHYVQDNCGNDTAVLLSIGFQAAAATRDCSPLANPSIRSIDRGNSDKRRINKPPLVIGYHNEKIIKKRLINKTKVCKKVIYYSVYTFISQAAYRARNQACMPLLIY